MGSDEVTTQPATAEIVGVAFVRPETSRIVYPRLLLPLKLRGAQAITTLLPKRGDRPRVTVIGDLPIRLLRHSGIGRYQRYVRESGAEVRRFSGEGIVIPGNYRSPVRESATAFQYSDILPAKKLGRL